MKRFVGGIIALLTSVAVFAQPAVYVVPATLERPGGFYVQMLVNQQGPFMSEIDTGSVNYMLPGNAQTCPLCNANPGIVPAAPLGRKFEVRYGSGRVLVAHAYRTRIQPITNQSDAAPVVFQTIGVVTAVSGNNNSKPVLGMAQPVTGSKPNSQGLTTYMQALMQSGVTKDLGFMLVGCVPPKSGTEMVLGGPDPRLQNTAPITEPLLSNQPHYVVTPVSLGLTNDKGKSVLIGRFNPPSDKKAPGVVIDSGGSYLMLQKNLFLPLMAVLKRADRGIPEAFWKGKPAVLSKSQIDALPSITMIFKDGSKISIPPQSYVIPVAHHPSQSKLAVGQWTHTNFGDPLFTAYAILFDRSTESLSFYPNDAVCRY